MYFCVMINNIKRNFSMYRFALFISILIASLLMGSGELQPLSLDECIELGKSSNPSAQMTKLELQSRAWQFEGHQATLKPQLMLSGNVPEFKRSINSIPQPDGSVQFLTQNQAYSNLNLSASHYLTQTGGSVWVSSALSRIDLFGDENSFYWQASPIILGFSQPLFQFNSLSWDKVLEPMKYKLAKKQFVENMEDVVIDISTRYFNYYISGISLENARFNTAINDTIYNISKGRYEVGKIAENDLLRTELAVMDARIALDQALLNHQLSYENLLITLGLGRQDSLYIQPPHKPDGLQLNVEEVLNLVRENNSKYLSWEIQNLEAMRTVKQRKSDRLLDANISASLGYNQTAGKIGDLYKNPLDRENVTLSFDMPLTGRKGNADLARAEADQQQIAVMTQNAKRTFELEIEYMMKELVLLRAQLEIAARSDSVAAMQFDVAKNRYMIGKIDITTLFNTQREKDNASRVYFQTLKNYWLKYYQIRQVTSFDFAERKPLTVSSYH